jgi:hypothetical protein
MKKSKPKWFNSTSFYQPEPAPPLLRKPDTDFDEGVRWTTNTIEIPAGCLVNPDKPNDLALKPETLHWLREHYYVCRTLTDESGVVRRYLTFGWIGPLLKFLEWNVGAGDTTVVRVPERIVREECICDNHAPHYQQWKYYLRDDVKAWLDANHTRYTFIPLMFPEGDIMEFFMVFHSEKDYILFRMWWC